MFTSRSIISSAYSIESSSVKSQLISVIICHHVLIFHKITMKLKYRCNSKQWFDFMLMSWRCSIPVLSIVVTYLCMYLAHLLPDVCWLGSCRSKVKYPARQDTYVVLFDVVRTFAGARRQHVGRTSRFNTWLPNKAECSAARTLFIIARQIKICFIAHCFYTRCYIYIGIFTTIFVLLFNNFLNHFFNN